MGKSFGLGRDFGIVFAGQVMTLVQGVILLPIIIRTSGEAILGAYVLLLSIVSFLFAVLGCGIPYRYRRKVVSAASRAERRRLFEPQFTFQAVAIALAAMVVLRFGNRFERWLFDGSAHFTPFYLVAWMAARLLYQQSVDYFQYTQRFLHYSLSSTANSYLFVAMLLIVVATEHSLPLDSLLLLQCAANLLACVPLLIKLLHEIGPPRLRLPWHELVADARVGLPLAADLLVEFLLRSSDRYLILLFLSVEAVGRYQPAYTIGSVAIFLVAMMETILIPTLSRLVDTGQRAEAAQLMTMLLRLFLMLAIPIAFGALVAGPTLVSLLATAEIGAASRWVTPLVAAATVFYGLARLASITAYVLGRTATILVANTFGAAVNLALNLVLLPLIRDITLPAATTLIGYAIYLVFLAGALRALWPVHIDWTAVSRYLAASAGMSALLWYVGFRAGEVSGMGAFSMAVWIAVAIAFYFALLYLLGGFGRREMEQLARLTRREMPETGQAAR